MDGRLRGEILHLVAQAMQRKEDALWSAPVTREERSSGAVKADEDWLWDKINHLWGRIGQLERENDRDRQDFSARLEMLQRAVAAVYFVYRNSEDGPLQVATYPDPDLSGLDANTTAEVVRALQDTGR